MCPGCPSSRFFKRKALFKHRLWFLQNSKVSIWLRVKNTGYLKNPIILVKWVGNNPPIHLWSPGRPSFLNPLIALFNDDLTLAHRRSPSHLSNPHCSNVMIKLKSKKRSIWGTQCKQPRNSVDHLKVKDSKYHQTNNTYIGETTRKPFPNATKNLVQPRRNTIEPQYIEHVFHTLD